MVDVSEVTGKCALCMYNKAYQGVMSLSGRSGAKVDAVYYNNLVALNGAVSHSGDEVTGQASTSLRRKLRRPSLVLAEQLANFEER